MTNRAKALAGVFAAGSLLAVAACGGSGDGDNDSSEEIDLPDLNGEKLSVAAVWSGAEQDVFEKVMDQFEDETGASVSFTSTGDDIATVLNSKLKGGDAPDVAFLPQPGLMNDYAEDGDIEPLSDDTVSAVDDNYADIWTDLGSYDGENFGVWFDVSNKSTVWYNVPAFEDAGIEEPDTWDEMLDAAQTLSDSGISVPVSLGGADGWTLTDWFENLYIRIAGADKYDHLSTHDIPWTDDSVVETLETMGDLFSDETLVGDADTALQVDFPSSVSNVFSDSPDSAIVYEGSFVAGEITDSSDYEIGDDARWFPFPAVGDSPESVVGGGDVGVQFNDDEATEAFMTFLSSPKAASTMVSTGSFESANKSMDLDAYPDENSREVGEAIVEAGDNFRFDMSDQAPSEFGATVGSGEWKILQDFLKDPSDPEATAEELEDAADEAYD